jgi:excisionase family DNA binding protein
MITVLRREALEREAELERARQEKRIKNAGVPTERIAELVRDDEILTAREVAVILKLTRKTVIELMGKGELPGRKIGNSWRVSKRS